MNLFTLMVANVRGSDIEHKAANKLNENKPAPRGTSEPTGKMVEILEAALLAIVAVLMVDGISVGQMRSRKDVNVAARSRDQHHENQFDETCRHAYTR